MSDSRDADEVLFAIQEHILDLRRAGQPVDIQELAQRFSVTVDEVEVCLRAAEVLGDTIDTTPAPPDLPAEFELLGELGRGGMGVVYRVHQKPLGRDVALKVLRTTQLDDAQSMQRFEHEARALARLRHPNIVGVHSVGRSGSAIYYTMDLVEGRDLAEVLAKRPLPIEQAVHLARQVADAVAHAHRQNILHRDLKPGNVLMDRDGNAHVVDFGLARDLSSDRSRQTATGQLLGTPGSMSPEQARGDGEAVSPATDVHGLGALLFEMLVGKPPFAADSLHELLRAVVENDPPRADSLRSAVPRDLATICEHAMARDPAARYPSAEAFADDLRRFAENEPIAAQPVGLLLRVGRRLVRERRLAMVLVAAVVLIAVAFFIGSRFEREGHSLTLASSLRSRGEVVAALAILEDADAALGSERQQQQWVQALLDCAEQSDDSEQAGAWLTRAGNAIRVNYRISRFGASSTVGGPSRVGALAPYRDEGFEYCNATNRASPPWSVLALRHAFLVGDLERVGIAFDQVEWMGPNLDNILDWTAAARADRSDPAHASALGVCMMLALDDTDRFESAFEGRDAPRQLWPDIVRVRDRLPAAAADAFDRRLGSVETHWKTAMSPGELLAIPMAQFANEVSTTIEQRANACALVAAAMGCPPAFGAGSQPIVYERTLTAWETWRRADQRTRVRVRNEHMAWLWQRLPTDFAEEQTLGEWFAIASGCPETERTAALSWWSERRADDALQLLARDDSDRDVDALLEGLGSLQGAEVRRVHELLALHAGGASVPWPGGGPAARGSVDDPRRIGWMHSWLRAFDRAAPREVRLRLAFLVFDDGATLPRVAARSSVTGRVGDTQTIKVDRRDLLVAPATRAIRYSRILDCNLLGIADSGARVEQGTKVTFLPGAGGAVALVEDDTWIATRNSEWSVSNRTGGPPARFAVGEVGALMSMAARWQSAASRTIEFVLMAALEDGEAPAGPWSAQTWTVGAERTLLATPEQQSPSRHALRAAAHLPMKAARSVLARAVQTDPEIDGETDYDFDEDRWLARLLAGEPGLEPVASAIRSLGDEWHGAAVWGRLLRTSEPGAVRDQARELLRPCHPGRAVATTLAATLSTEERQGDVQERIEQALEPGWSDRVRWITFAVVQAAWLLSLILFFRAEPRSLRREQLRVNTVFTMAIGFNQSVVVASFAWPIPWLWFALNAWVYHRDWSERERSSRMVRLTGQLLVALTLVFVAASLGWWNAQSKLVMLLPPLVMLLAGVGALRAALALQAEQRRARAEKRRAAAS